MASAQMFFQTFTAVKRLMREAKELSESTPEYFAQPLSDNLFEWHFTVRGPGNLIDNLNISHSGMRDTPKLLAPPNDVYC